MSITIAGVESESAKVRKHRMSVLLWGPSGGGKTSLAATMPGKKLFLMFDPDGDASIASMPDIEIVNLGSAKPALCEQFCKDNVLGLEQYMDSFDSIIVDSLTSVSDIALQYGIMKNTGATVARPSPGAYGSRNTYTIQLVRNMLRLTMRYKKHLCFIAHEGTPKTNDEGSVLFITLLLGGQLPQLTSLDFSEVWYINDTGKKRVIAVRPCRFHGPMKSRMFKAAAPEFTWACDLFNDNQEIVGIETWYKLWEANSFAKISTPA